MLNLYEEPPLIPDWLAWGTLYVLLIAMAATGPLMFWMILC